MKDLSKSAVSTIVSALIAVRLNAIKSHNEAALAGQVHYQTTIQKELDENAAVLRELNEDVAPWLRYHPQLRDLFPGSEFQNIGPNRNQPAQEAQ